MAKLPEQTFFYPNEYVITKSSTTTEYTGYTGYGVYDEFKTVRLYNEEGQQVELRVSQKDNTVSVDYKALLLLLREAGFEVVETRTNINAGLPHFNIGGYVR